jgi:hypothetical protein
VTKWLEFKIQELNPRPWCGEWKNTLIEKWLWNFEHDEKI